MPDSPTPRDIDLERWPRRAQYELFRSFGFPYLSVTAPVDIAPLRAALKRRGISFTVGWVHALARAANAMPELRQRLRGERVVEHAAVHPSFTVLTDDGQFSFCNLPYHEDLDEFSRTAADRIERAKRTASLFMEPDRDDFLFMTAMPWVSFTGFVHPATLDPRDSVPRFAWGRFEEGRARTMIPLNLQVHHALVDGIHVGAFFEGVRREIERMRGIRRHLA